jgi:2-amino-4-hydroxy-6-hydroxymethyldihydropteridine diphosphokinase
MHFSAVPPMTERVALGLGSNVGDRLGHLKFAVRDLGRLLVRPSCSSVYESAPMYVAEQPEFLNACCVGATALGPPELLSTLQRIEREAGRRTGGTRYGARELDLDLLLYGDRVIARPGLRIPHPRMSERPFVLWPLAEVAGDWVHPETGLGIDEMAARLQRGRGDGLRVYAPPAALEEAGRAGGHGAGRLVLLAALLLPLACAACSGADWNEGAGTDGSAVSTTEIAAPGTAGDLSPRSADTALARLAGELLPEVERRSRLRAVRPPALASSSREELERFLERSFAEQLPAEKAEAVAAVYVRLGLLPDTLQLVPLLRSLLLEQVMGYYDPRSDTLFVVEGVPEEQLEPVLVHEMVHALQDQRIDLDSLTRALKGDNDRAAAAQAALEGHATYVMMEWLLSRQTGGSVDLAALPDLGAILGGLGPAVLAGTPVLSDAPRVIRESLIFPYMGGLVFLQRFWAADPDRPLPFGDDLPASSEQVLHADRFLGERDEPSDVVFSEEAPPGWRDVHTDGLGELETRVFLEEHLGDRDAAVSAAQGWDGDQYRLLRGPPGEVFIWATVWDSEEEAAEFEDAVRRAFERRYAVDSQGGPTADRKGGAAGVRAVTVERRLVDGRPAVLIVDTPASLPADSIAAALRFEVRGG